MTDLHSPDNELPGAIIGLPIPEPNTILRNDSKVLVGENGCSKYFMLGKLEVWRQVWSARQWQRKYLDFYTSPTKAEQRFLGKPHSAGTRPSVGLRSDDALPSPMTPSTRCAHRLVANRPIPRALFGDHKRHDFLTWWLFSKRAA
jgi:hypothetical protein